jgi:aspartate-semialdehyde dehydrogenase
MTSKIYRIGVVGASSLAGKELSEELAESPLAASNITLLEDEDDAAGNLAATGDEISFIQKLDETSFEGMDFVFFTSDAEGTTKHWEEARQAGAGIVDMTYALEGQKDVPVVSPWISEALGRQGRIGAELHLETQAVVPAHPVVVMLGVVAARIHTQIALETVAATVMEPASEHGRAAMDEMHQQTVSLLSFQDLPKEQYDSQVAFNLLPALGSTAKVDLKSTEERIRRQYKALSNGSLPKLSLQLVQAPVFHGYAASVYIQTKGAVSVRRMEAALAGEHIDIVTDESDAPSNLTAAGQEEIMVRVESASDGEETGHGFWLWLAVDNLKLAAIHAIACAGELGRLRPSGKVQ